MTANIKDIISEILATSIAGKNDSDSHLMTIFSIAVSLKAKTILELGVRDGTTTKPLLAAAKINGGFLNSVDIKPTSYTPPDELAPYWKFYVSDALEYLRRAKETNGEKAIDLVYIDDWHSYEHVAAELKILDELVSPSSVILLHDLMYANWEPHYHSDIAVQTGQWAKGGPYRAVAELDQNFWEFSTIPASNGLTVLRKKYSSRFHK